MKIKYQFLAIGILCIPSILLFLQLKHWAISHTKFVPSKDRQSIRNIAEESQETDNSPKITFLTTIKITEPRNGKTLDGYDKDSHEKVFNSELLTTKSPTLRHFHTALEARQKNFDEKKRSQTSNLTGKAAETGNSSKFVLIYTPLFEKIPWPGLETSYNFTHWGHKACPETNCKITYNKTLLPSANVVLFHGRDMPTVKEMKKISVARPATQTWVYFMQENPIFTYYDPGMYNGFFNWTMTYRRDSDIFVPYRHYSPLTASDQVPELKNYASGKDKLVAWMVGHCGNAREQYAQILSQFLQVDVYGACAVNFDQLHECPKGSQECKATLKRYKFYLSFENGFCVDYITEKYWFTPFNHDMVPVVFGGSDYGPEVAIPGSYINVLDFPKIESLANYLIYLHENDTAYNEYFSWKQKYKLVQPVSWTCQMCSMLNKKLESQTYYDLSKFWGINETCRVHEDQINKLIGEYEDIFSKKTSENINATQTFLVDQLTSLGSVTP